MRRASTACTVLLLILSISPASAQTVIGGVIVSDTNLPADTYHLTSDLTVSAGVTLTLSPGVVIKSNQGRRIVIDGTLLAVGTSVDAVVFTEARDDSVGIPVTPGIPSPGYWNGIEVRDGGNAVLEQVRIRYTGNSSLISWALRKSGSGSLTLRDSTLSLGSREGLRISTGSPIVVVENTLINDFGQQGVEVDGSSADLTLTDNQITGNGIGVQFGDFSGTLSMTGNQVTGNNASGLFIFGLPISSGISGNTFTGNDPGNGPIRLTTSASASIIDASNTLDGPLRIDGGALAAGVTSWVNPYTYRITGAVTVPAGSTLDLPPGTVVKADPGSPRLIVDGDLNAVGTIAEPIVLTETRDDSAGGDSGFAGDPAPGAWQGVEVRDGGNAVLEQVRIRYTGNSSLISWALRKSGSGDLLLGNSVITLGARDGVVVDGATGTISLQTNQIIGMRTGVTLVNVPNPPSLTNNRIMNNGFRGVLIENASPTITGGRIAGNGEAGVWVSGADSAPEIAGVWISGNAIGVDSHSGADPLIGGSADKGNDLVGNTQFGVRNNDDSLTLNARFNWWGDASGPLDPLANPDGLGDPVSEWVDYGDFLDRSAVDNLFADRFQNQP
ncbi:MAG: right-handed parallel beta-helix repeat-containing protein [Wenzhouxiangella sp.]|jgi:hypothetical protein|nr:right-handed parallel beta-helix repeat-containing protein [Wenzhouxiangella sp.]